MKNIRTLGTTAVAALGLALGMMTAGNALADTFGSGANTFTIDFTTVGNPGNAADTTGNPNPAGSVGYTYRIGTYEVSEDMITKANALGNLAITKDTLGPNKPATKVSWNEAARFVNWLNESEGFSVAYKFTLQPGDVGYSSNADAELWVSGDTGYNAANPYRNSNAQYFLPSTDEWYKAAYYDAEESKYYNYPTASDTAPTAVAGGTVAGTAVFGGLSAPADITNAGGLSSYGTMGQGGNVMEWNESVGAAGEEYRTVRGGGYSNAGYSMASDQRSSFTPGLEGYNNLGFRVASVPEPSSAVLVLMGLGAYLLKRRTKRSL